MQGSDKTEGISPVVVPINTGMTAEVYRKKVLIALPWQKTVSPVTAFSVSNLADKRRAATMLCFGDAFVAHSRNTCVDAFLATDLDHFLTVDDDMVLPFGNSEWFQNHTGFNLPEPFASLNALDRLLSHNKTLVGALYFGRHKHGAPMFAEGVFNTVDAAYSRTAPVDVLKPTRWVGTGCMLIHRSVFLDIEKKFPRLARQPNGKGGQWFSSSEHNVMQRIDETRDMLGDGPMTGEKAFKAFTMLESASAEAKRQSSLGVGEDVQFCHRAKEAGHQPFVDFGLVVGHLGHTCYGPKNTSPKPK